jgi:hypothetical protein
MSADRTRPMPVPGQYPVYRPARARRRRWPLVLLGLLTAAVLLLVGADRAAAAYAASQAAQQMKAQGFPGNPQVTMEGFPFLTQVLSRNLRDVHVSDPNVALGPVTGSLVGDAAVRLSPGYQSGTVTSAHGTVLISFASLAGLVKSAGFPADVTAAAAGPGKVKITASLAIFTATIVASLTQAGPGTVRFHVISASGVPGSLLGSFSNMTFSLPKLPYGLAIQHITITPQGAVAYLTAHDIPFTR